MGRSNLTWYADRGLELDADVEQGEAVLRLAAVPLPVDGWKELRAGAELDRLDTLFKASIDVAGEPGQLQVVRVTLLDADPPQLQIDATWEELETGAIASFQASVPVVLPPDVPEAGGPRPAPTDEDDLDLEDDTTIEKLVESAPPIELKSQPVKAPSDKGLEALLKALAGDDDDLPQESGLEEPTADLHTAIDDDQILDENEEALSFLQLLVSGEHLELEDDASIDDLTSGFAPFLASDQRPAAKAAHMSSWLLDQPSVADLFIGDDDLAELLDKW